jgi:hypothetical protein
MLPKRGRSPSAVPGKPNLFHAFLSRRKQADDVWGWQYGSKQLAFLHQNIRKKQRVLAQVNAEVNRR